MNNKLTDEQLKRLIIIVKRSAFQFGLDKNEVEQFKEIHSALTELQRFRKVAGVPFYRHAQPAPAVEAVPEKLSRELFEKWCPVNIERNKWHPELYAHLPARQQWDAWNACRAAMLNHSGEATEKGKADGALTNEVILPATKIKPVADLYGITPSTSGETSFTFDAVEAADFIASGCSVQEYVELERYQQACADTPPVIPDGYALVPIEPTEDMIINGFESEPDESFSKPEEWEQYESMSGCQQAAHRARLCWNAMIAAAPEVGGS